MGTVASIRLDAVMSVAFQSSRSSLLSLIDGGMVFVNGRLITTNAYTLKQGDLISARGEGKFRYRGCRKRDKKGRILIRVRNMYRGQKVFKDPEKQENNYGKDSSKQTYSKDRGKYTL